MDYAKLLKENMERGFHIDTSGFIPASGGWVCDTCQEIVNNEPVKMEVDKTGLIECFIGLNNLMSDSKKPKDKDDSPLDFYVHQSVAGSLSDIKELLRKLRGV